MYTLILISLLKGGYNGAGASTEGIPGFATQELCMAASREWLKQMHSIGFEHVRAICARAQ
jgi:hypothetical protein